MIDVTIIVPVYNVEKHIKKCLDSLVEQDYSSEKIEIFLINDCSTDKSLETMLEYKKKYNNITVKDLDQNHGVSYARNIGIKEAKGKYIMFCDADDYYEKNSVSTFMNEIDKTNADFITANYFISDDNHNIKVNTSNFFNKNRITKKEIVSFMTLTSCSKIIKRDLFIKNNLYYPEDIKRCEELEVIPVVAYLAEKPIAIDDTLYHYYQRKTSVSNNNKNLTIEDLGYFDTTFNHFRSKIDEEKYKEEVEFRAIEFFAYSKVLIMLKTNLPNGEIKKYIIEFQKKYCSFKKNKYLKSFSISKKVFIRLLNSRILVLHKIFASIHKKITG